MEQTLTIIVCLYMDVGQIQNSQDEMIAWLSISQQDHMQ